MTLYLNKKPYTGLACYINGYNGIQVVEKGIHTMKQFTNIINK